MTRPKSRNARKRQRTIERKQDVDLEVKEIGLINQWVEAQKPDSGSNPLSLKPLEKGATVGPHVDDKGVLTFSRYSGVRKFAQLPVSKKTKLGLKEANYTNMTDIQVAALPHALCGRDILGAAKTGSGKTLAFIIPALEKLYRDQWGPEDGVGCIIISPTRELAGQIFDVLKAVGKQHNFSAGLLIGGRKGVGEEKDHVNDLNILVCTPGRLLQHMDETPNFDCSQLQVLVLDEADRILDIGFKKTVNGIVSQLPKHRQTLLFSATQTKSVKDLARLSLKDPEYLSVHEEAKTATPDHLMQTAMIVPLEQKLDMLWSFLKSHLNSKILVFLSSCKQVKFVYEAFKKLRPGVPLKCLHGRMNQEKRMVIYSQFCESRNILFTTDVSARGLDFNKAVDWVVQVDCPEDVASYIHRVGRTARYHSGGRSLLFLTPSEVKMLEKLQAAKIPVNLLKANSKRLQPVSGLLSSLLVKYPDLQPLAQRAFITYLRSIHIQKDKEVFDVMKLSIDDFSASLGLPMTPKVRFLKQKIKGRVLPVKLSLSESEASDKENASVGLREALLADDFEEDNRDDDILLAKDKLTEGNEGNASQALDKENASVGLREALLADDFEEDDGDDDILLAKDKLTEGNEGNASQALDKENASVGLREALLADDFEEDDGDDDILLANDKLTEGNEGNASQALDATPVTRVLKNKKIKINIHRPAGTRVVFDEGGKPLPPLARVADMKNDDAPLDLGEKEKYYKRMREELKKVDKEDKLLDQQRRREKRIKERMKQKQGKEEMEDDKEGFISGSDAEVEAGRESKRSKIYFDGYCDNGDQGEDKSDKNIGADSISIAEQEALALKLLSSMHS